MNNSNILFINPVPNKEVLDVYVSVISCTCILKILLHFHSAHIILHELVSFDFITLILHIHSQPYTKWDLIAGSDNFRLG